MKKYLIKKTYTPTKQNDRFNQDYIEVWYCGKNCSDKELCDYIKKNGYSRKHFVEKQIQKCVDFDKEYTKYWNVDYKILEVEI